MKLFSTFATAVGMVIASVLPGPSHATTCSTGALPDRDLYLRGTFNAWGAPDTHRFRKLCDRWELITQIEGQHEFKLGDEEWSSGTDWGIDPATQTPPWRLLAKGKGIHHRFTGRQRFTLTMTDQTPSLRIDECAPAPAADTPIFLRGSMNNWNSLDEYAFVYSCDAYYLNVSLKGAHEFKIADASWNFVTTWGGAENETSPLTHNQATALFSRDSRVVGNLRTEFVGEHTLRLEFIAGKARLTIGPKTYADQRAQPINDPIANSIRFDSRDARYRRPFGATPAGAPVQFTLTSAKGIDAISLVVERRSLEGNQERIAYADPLRVPLRPTPQGEGLRWTGSHVFSQVGVHGYWFEVRIGSKTYRYQNNRESVYWTRERGNNGIGIVEEATANERTIRRFRHTVHVPGFKVPAWAKDAIYYYIFPERFRNGDARNDPTPGRNRYQNHDVEKHANWLDKPFKPGTNDGSDKVYNNDFFGGDLAGVIEKLDYIKSVGANVLYLTPVFHAASNHKYDTADYRNVDPSFGSNADFERLTREAAKRGIRVVPDVSFNHTGSDSLYFDRFGNFGGQGAFANAKINKRSPYASWYTFDTTQAEPDKQYRGWVDVQDLPELNKNDRSWRDFAYGPNGVTQLWLKRGASGWRMDVAPWVPDDFWREWRKAVKKESAEAVTIAETWFDASKHLAGDMFDSTMNYIFRSAVLDYVKGGSAKTMVANLEYLREVYPSESHFALMNLLSSHDVARTLHVLGYEDEKTDANKVAAAKRRFALALFMQMTYAGAPAIYYGDEVGMTGGEDPYNRGTFPWKDLGGRPDEQLLAYVQSLTKLRQQHAVLRRGEVSPPLYVDDQVVVMGRQLGNSWALVALNNATTERVINLLPPTALSTANLQRQFGDATAVRAKDTLQLTLSPLSGAVWISNARSRASNLSTQTPSRN